MRRDGPQPVDPGGRPQGAGLRVGLTADCRLPFDCFSQEGVSCSRPLNFCRPRPAFHRPEAPQRPSPAGHGRRVRVLLKGATRSRLVGFFSGGQTGAIIQSSMLSTLITANLVRSGALTIRDAIPVVAGANVGTSAPRFRRLGGCEGRGLLSRCAGRPLLPVQAGPDAGAARMLGVLLASRCCS